MGDLGSIPGSGRSPGEGKGNTLQYSGLENSMDSPWGRKELDTTERLSLSQRMKMVADSLESVGLLKAGQTANYQRNGDQEVEEGTWQNPGARVSGGFVVTKTHRVRSAGHCRRKLGEG